MTSSFARNGCLSKQTHLLWTTLATDPHDITHRLNFYLSYFADVVPTNISVLPNPITDSLSDTQQGLHLQHKDTKKIWISGLIGFIAKHQSADDLTNMAGEDAWDNYRDGKMMVKGETWRFFTGMGKISIYGCCGVWKYEPVLMGVFEPMRDAGGLAEWLQREYEGMGS